MIVQSQTSGEESTRLLCFPVQVPVKYFPLVLVGLFCLLMGPQLPILLAAALGYGYSKGHLPLLLFSSSRIHGTEFWFGSLAEARGFVPHTHATGFSIPVPGGGDQGQTAWSLPSLPSLPGVGTAATTPFSGSARTLGESSGAGAAGMAEAAGTETRGSFGEEEIFLLTSMGFGRDEAQAALERNHGDVSAAANSLAV